MGKAVGCKPGLLEGALPVSAACHSLRVPSCTSCGCGAHGTSHPACWWLSPLVPFWAGQLQQLGQARVQRPTAWSSGTVSPCFHLSQCHPAFTCPSVSHSLSLYPGAPVNDEQWCSETCFGPASPTPGLLVLGCAFLGSRGLGALLLRWSMCFLLPSSDNGCQNFPVLDCSHR